MKRSRNIAFIVELLLLFVILLFVIVTITRTFMASRGQSLHALHLTEAVTIAEDLAELTKETVDQDEAEEKIGAAEGALDMRIENENTLTVVWETVFNGKRADQFTAMVSREEEETPAGSFVTEHISVFYGNSADTGTEEPLYELETGWYRVKQ